MVVTEKTLPKDATTRPRSHGPVIPVPRHRPGYLGPVHITQLLLAELAMVAVLAAITQGLVFAVGAVAGAVVLLGVTFARRGGRWWIERRVMAARYRRRRRDATGVGPGQDPRLAALRRLAPGLTVENVPVAGGGLVGVARDDAGWFAIASIAGDATMGATAAVLPLDLLATALAEAEQPGAVLQVVFHTVPAPGSGTGASSPVDDSYRQLLASLGPTLVPADQTTWIAVRLDARALAEALGDRSADLDTAPAVVAALIRRVTKALRPLGITPRLLDADGMLAALAYSCDLEYPPAAAQAAAPAEDWSAWRSARFAHRCFWIREWPPIDATAGVLQSIFSVPAAMTSVSLILAPDYGDPAVDLKALVRVATPPGQLDDTCRSIVKGASRARAGLFRLDGEQSPAVYATAPTGGGAR